MVYQCTITGQWEGESVHCIACVVSHLTSSSYILHTHISLFCIYATLIYQLNAWGLVMVYLVITCTDIKMFPIKFCTNGKYLQEHIEKINYKYFHHTNGKRHHMVGSISTVVFRWFPHVRKILWSLCFRLAKQIPLTKFFTMYMK